MTKSYQHGRLPPSTPPIPCTKVIPLKPRSNLAHWKSPRTSREQNTLTGQSTRISPPPISHENVEPIEPRSILACLSSPSVSLGQTISVEPSLRHPCLLFAHDCVLPPFLLTGAFFSHMPTHVPDTAKEIPFERVDAPVLIRPIRLDTSILSPRPFRAIFFDIGKLAFVACHNSKYFP